MRSGGDTVPVYIWTLERDREQSLFWLVAVVGAGGVGWGAGVTLWLHPPQCIIYLSSTMFKKSIGYRLALPLVVSEFSV